MSRMIQTAQTVMAGRTGGEKAGDILFAVLLDRLWKAGIVVAAAILVLTTMIIIYRRAGTE